MSGTGGFMKRMDLGSIGLIEKSKVKSQKGEWLMVSGKW